MKELISQIKKYFSIKELVSKQVYDKYGEGAWVFFDYRLLSVILWLRESMGIPLVCNNWSSGGHLSQRGFRCNLDPIVLEKTESNKIYCSSHSRGQGIDLSSGRASAPVIREWIRKHIDDCPYPIRLEDDYSAPTWVHIDVCNTTDNKLVEFKA